MAGYEYFPDCFAEPERFCPGDRSGGSHRLSRWYDDEAGTFAAFY